MGDLRLSTSSAFCNKARRLHSFYRDQHNASEISHQDHRVILIAQWKSWNSTLEVLGQHWNRQSKLTEGTKIMLAPSPGRPLLSSTRVIWLVEEAATVFAVPQLTLHSGGKPHFGAWQNHQAPHGSTPWGAAICRFATLCHPCTQRMNFLGTGLNVSHG